MPTGLKLFVTIAAVVFSIGIFLINPKTDNAGADRLWRGGKDDPFRSLLMQGDGKFRRFAKAAILIFFVIFLAVVWLVVPTQA